MRAKQFGWILPICFCALVPALCAAQAAAPAKKPTDPALLTPAKLTEKAPDVYRAKFTTTKGDFVIEVTRAWAPQGADRFFNLVKHHYYDEASFFRVVKQPRPFMVQFGISADPKVNVAWQEASIKDDPVAKSNTRGMVTYAAASDPNTRTTQVFINFGDNSFLDKSRFAPFGQVVEGMDIVEQLYSGYGDGLPQDRIQGGGRAFLDQNYPKLDHIVTAVIVVPEGAAPATKGGKAPAKP